VRFPDDSPVTAQKREALRARLRSLNIDLAGVDEQAIRAGGPGGQKVNKTSSGVLLRHVLDSELIVVKWTRERHRALNRFLALRELADEVEARLSPQTSERQRELVKKRKQKDRRRRRTRSAPPA
jgi:protein subunit release factor B